MSVERTGFGGGGAAVRSTGARARVSTRTLAFVALLVVYAVFTLCIVYPTPLLDFDSYLRNLYLRHYHPGWKPYIFYYVMLGQRGPATLFFLPWFCWVAWRDRSPRPLVMLGVALVLLNVTVGIVKLATSRLSPRETPIAHAFFESGGTIYPSGHVSNTVVLYGLLAWIAVRHRKALIVATVFISITVGAGTVYLKTHWFSDIVGAWLAGGLVLLALPWVVPPVERWVDRLVGRLRSRRARSARHAAPRHAAPRLPVGVGAGSGSADRDRDHENATPVRSVARSQSFSATFGSFDERDESTRRGAPRSSPIPSGP